MTQAPPRHAVADVIETQPKPPTAASRLLAFVVRRRESTIALAGLILAGYFAFVNDAFLTTANIRIISQFVIPVAILATGQTMLLICGEIDLSMGAVYFMTPFIVYFAHDAGLPLPIAVLIGLLGASVVGFVNAGITIAFGIPSFIVTLGMMLVVGGITLNISDGFPKRAPSEGMAVDLFGGARFSGFAWAVLIAVVMQIVLTQTRWGVHTIATGGNPTGAREAGIPANRIRVRNFAVASMLAGFAGTIEGIRIGSFDPGAAVAGQKVFDAVAAAVIGGTLLTGGSGTVIGALLGAIVLAILRDGFIIEGVSAFTFNIVLGASIIVAMILNVIATRLRIRLESGHG
jgi:simple sugar transport system permease protein